MKKRIQALAVCTAVVAGGFGIASAGESEPALDGIYGFGQSEGASLRDDSIALYEAYQVERAVVGCMARNGFKHVPELVYPHEAALAVADELGVVPEDDGLPLPRLRNDESQRGRSESAREAVLTAKWGPQKGRQEGSGNNVRGGQKSDASARTGMGCVSEAQNQVGSVWDLRRLLFNDVIEARRLSTNLESFKLARRSFDQCVESALGYTVEDISVVEELAEDQPQVRECSQYWISAKQSVEKEAVTPVLSKYQAEIDSHQTRYDTVRSDLSRDSDFRDWLGRIRHDIESMPQGDS